MGKIMLNVIKRNGSEVEFNPEKIRSAITRANAEVDFTRQLSDEAVQGITTDVTAKCMKMPHAAHVEEIQEMVEDALMASGSYEVAKAYIRYRYEHALRRKGNSIDAAVLGIVEYNNEEVKQENSNKNPQIIPTQRDYIAGEVSKDIVRRMMLPKEITDAHDEGIIHFHDADYFIQRSHNCDLVNLEDMLQNGTVISGTMIEKPHMFSTACNIATQIIAQVASCQYGFPM